MAITVTGENNGLTLANTVLGSGIAISNVSYTGANNQAGTFTDGLSAGIGIDIGILLTTGSVNNVTETNTSDNIGTGLGAAGDVDLDNLSGVITFDANILEFDFTSNTGDLFFNYVFASEEYNEFANDTVNDTFGFFVDNVNIALIPGTTTPVSINTVNGGDPFGTNPQNSAFFINNDLDDGGPFFNIEYDGFTTVFTAQLLGLTAGSHHIKMAIADGGDDIFDSGVFIEAGTFSSSNPVPDPVPEPATVALLGIGLVGLAGAEVRRRRKKKAVDNT